MNRPELSVVVPVYNEEENLPVFLERLLAACEARTRNFEVIFCDDGSTDRTAEVALAWRRRDDRIKLLRLSRNFGHHHAAQAGMEHASGDWLFCLDGDLQDPPELLAELFAKADEGYEVINARKLSRPERGLRGLAFRGFHKLLAATSSEIALEPNLGFFSLMSRRAYLHLRAMPESRKFLAGMRQWIGFRQAQVDFERPAREHGESRQSAQKLATLALDALFAFSSKPIKLIWMLGVFGILLSLAVAGFSLYHHFFTHLAITGWTSIITAVLFMGSVQLVCVSLLGEYIWRIYVQVQARPYYLIGERHGLEPAAERLEPRGARDQAA